MSLLAIIAGYGGSPPLAAAPADDWLPTTAPPRVPGTLRSRTLVPLPSGLVLSYAHGYGPTAEGYFYRSSIFDPALETWSAGGPWSPQAGNEAPIVLADGRVLLTGGRGDLACISPGCSDSVATAQIYDPATDAWSAVAPMPTDRLLHCTTRLNDGAILVIGGYAPRGRVGAPVTRTVRYDPRTDRWTEVATLPLPLLNCAATQLADGRVLAIGTAENSDYTRPATALLYDVAADQWSTLPLPVVNSPSPTGAVPFYSFSSIVALPGGQFLALFREGAADGRAVALRFDPAASRWKTAAAPPAFPIAPTRLTDGRIIALTIDNTAIAYDATADRWLPLAAPPAIGSLAPLPGGRVLLLAEEKTAILGDPARPRFCFAETGACLSGRFLAYWEANGGLAANGFPLTDPLAEELEDGQTYTVQYFERVRLEYHPANPPPHDLLLGQFGRRLYPAAPPVAPLPDARFFPQTGHNLSGAFRIYWEANGGLERFGYPLGEIETERLEDGGTYQVQYFERARLEYHPENAPPYDVLAGQFGRRILRENRWLDEDPALKRRYLSNATLQAALGSPQGAVAHFKLEFQAFERGVVLLPLDPTYGGGLPLDFAYVLCDGTPASGRTVRTIALGPDREPPATVPAPGSGLFIPIGGIGDLWLRDAGVRACLGYAVDPSATGSIGAARGVFAGGVLLTGSMPDGTAIYALYSTPDDRGYLNGDRYERLPSP